MASQVHFTGEVGCEAFAPHRLKPNLCVECNKLMEKHSLAAAPSDDVVIAALEYSGKGARTPSCILPAGWRDGFGALYMGGFRGVLNGAFLAEGDVRSVVSAASGLDMFGPAWARGRAAAVEAGIEFMELPWSDSADQALEGMAEALAFCHSRLGSGHGVLVHCAQGKSRSGAVVVAYVASALGLSVEEALERVREGRRMCEPNSGFMAQLPGLVQPLSS